MHVCAHAQSVCRALADQGIPYEERQLDNMTFAVVVRGTRTALHPEGPENFSSSWPKRCACVIPCHNPAAHIQQPFCGIHCPCAISTLLRGVSMQWLHAAIWCEASDQPSADMQHAEGLCLPLGTCCAGLDGHQ